MVFVSQYMSKICYIINSVRARMRKEKLNYIADIKHKNLLVKLTRKSKDSL